MVIPSTTTGYMLTWDEQKARIARSFFCAFNMLFLMGFYPEVEYFDRAWESETTFEDAELMHLNYFTSMEESACSKGANRFGSCTSAKPMPVSVTSKRSLTCDSISASIKVRMVTLPEGVNLMALPTRLSKACVTRKASPLSAQGMGITLYTAPDCIRCKIVKAFLAERGLTYDTIDFKADAQKFNTFYRTNRKAIYRNPEGVEFPLFADGEVIKQGSGEIIAYLLSGHTLEACVTRSDMLHGKIAGLYPSQCPAGQEDNFAVLVDRLAAGGLQVWLQTDGRKPELLEKLLKIKDVHAVCNLVGGPEASTKIFGGAPSKEELAKTIALVQATPDGAVRFLAMGSRNPASLGVYCQTILRETGSISRTREWSRRAAFTPVGEPGLGRS